MMEKHELCEMIKELFTPPEPIKQLTPAEKKDVAKTKQSNLMSFSDPALLGAEYLKRFKGNIDQIWEKCDVGKHKMLDKKETKGFLEELQKIVNSDVSGHFDPNLFDK
jgi:hypothetical protein